MLKLDKKRFNRGDEYIMKLTDIDTNNISNEIIKKVLFNTPKNEYSGGFMLPDCHDYVPLLQLCVCYDKLGDPQKAKEYNERAGACKPYSQAYLYNKRYFDSL